MVGMNLPTSVDMVITGTEGIGQLGGPLLLPSSPNCCEIFSLYKASTDG